MLEIYLGADLSYAYLFVFEFENCQATAAAVCFEWPSKSYSGKLGPTFLPSLFAGKRKRQKEHVQ